MKKLRDELIIFCNKHKGIKMPSSDIVIELIVDNYIKSIDSKNICPRCNGYGHITIGNGFPEKCYHCNGEGKIKN